MTPIRRTSALSIGRVWIAARRADERQCQRLRKRSCRSASQPSAEQCRSTGLPARRRLKIGAHRSSQIVFEDCSLWYNICVPWIDTGAIVGTSFTVSIKGTVMAFADAFVVEGGSGLIPRRDILIPRFVFRAPNS